MATKKQTEKKATTTDVEGVTFVSNVLQPYSTGKINAKKIYELSENLYISGPIRQMTNLILSGEIKISVYNETDDVVEDVSRHLNEMFSTPVCNLTACARNVISDLYIWGISIFNPVWSKYGGELVCDELNHLNSYTFRDVPVGVNTLNYITGRLLKGVVYNTTDRTTHYYQVQNSGQSVEINHDYLFVVREPSSNFPDGDSVILPTAPVAEFLNYAWNALGQQMYRTGAPIMFITISNPQPERMNGSELIESDVDYANKVLANWGKDTPYVLRENMTISTIDVNEGSLAIVSITKGGETIRDYISPVGMLGKDGTLISGNSNASLRLINNHIKGWINLLINSLRELPNYYLRGNSYPEGWHAEIDIPSTTIEDTTARYNTATLLSNTKTGTINEVRELLGLEGISDEELSEMKEQWDILNPSSSGLMFTDRNRLRMNKLVDDSKLKIYESTSELFSRLTENKPIVKDENESYRN